MANVPRLTGDTGYHTELAANALSIPALGVYDAGRGLGFLIGVQVYGSWGVTGVNLTSAPGEPIRIDICLPVMRTRRYRLCDWAEVTDEPGMDLLPGAPVACRIHIEPVAADSNPTFIARIAAYGERCRGQAVRSWPLMPADLAELVENKHDIGLIMGKSCQHAISTCHRPFPWVADGPRYRRVRDSRIFSGHR